MDVLPDIEGDLVENADDYDVVGEVSVSTFAIPYTKADLLSFRSFTNNGGGVRLHRQSSRRGRACEYVRFQVDGQTFHAISHDPSGDGEIPSSALPLLLAAYSSSEIDPYLSHVIILGPEVSPDISVPLARFVESVVLSDRRWSIFRLARDVYFDPPPSGAELYQRLIADAYASSLIKHSFFDLFRCVERASLEKLLARINSDFYDDPSKTIESASKALSSERLLLEVPLDAQKRMIVAAFERFELLRTSNRFTMALYSSSKDKLPPDKFLSGLNLLYKIRCSIAHAKADDLLIEAFPDYEAALEEITLFVEIVALAYAGFKLDVALV